jgi:hypothetical protein
LFLPAKTNNPSTVANVYCLSQQFIRLISIVTLQPNKEGWTMAVQPAGLRLHFVENREEPGIG